MVIGLDPAPLLQLELSFPATHCTKPVLKSLEKAVFESACKAFGWSSD